MNNDGSRDAPRIVIIGAGIVGCALADELTARGLREVTVLEQGPLYAPGGSSSHAPGLVFRTSTSRTLTELACYTVSKFQALGPAGSCFEPVGGLEVATTGERWTDLHRRAGLAAASGVEGELLTPRACAERWPMLNERLLYGGFHTPGDGLAHAVLAGQAQAERAITRGAVFRERHTVTGIERGSGTGAGVTAVTTDRGSFPAEVVISAAGFWGPVIGAMAGLTVPLRPLAHQYARTSAVPGLQPDAGLSILRHQDQALYFRQHGNRLGIGSYAHRPLPVDPLAIPRYDDAAVMPSSLPFTEPEFAPSWAQARRLIPALGGARLAEGFDGVFSFTPDGMPLIGESRELPGFWLAEAVWVTHSAGVARALAAWLADGRPPLDLHSCHPHRFDDAQLSPAYIAERGDQSFSEVYDIIHPLEPVQRPRPLRTSPFYPRQLELGAYQLEGAGWERPHWYEANASLASGLDLPARDPWAARHWSPIVAAEARATRERVALYDMTPLRRLDVSGPGALAFLHGLTTNELGKRPGRITYTLMLDQSGGIRSDLTIARLAEDRFQVGCNSNLDLDWMLRALPADGTVQIRDLTPGTCCVGVWGPLARALVQPLTRDDFSHRGFGFYQVRRCHIGVVPVTAMRLSYVGELGWELYTTADLGLRLWDTLWQAGGPLGVVAAGRGAFNSLRLEKGYRAWGRDMTAEHHPREAGLDFAVRLGKGPFTGSAALAALGPEGDERRLACLTLDDPSALVLGDEPVYADGGRDGAPAGYVTSADYGYTIGRAIAYAWLPAALAAPGTPLRIAYLGETLAATVQTEPLVDPQMARIRR